MKIVFLLNGGSKFDPSSFDWLTLLATDLASDGQEVKVVDQLYDPGDLPIESGDNITIVRLRLLGLIHSRSFKPVNPFLRGLERVLWAVSLWKFALAEDADAFVCNYPWAGLLLVHFSRRLRGRLIMYSMALFMPSSTGIVDSIRLRIESIVGWFSRMTVAENEIGMNRLHSAGIPIDKLTTIEPPVDTSFWSGGSPNPSLKGEFGMRGKFIALMAARIVKRKGVDTLVEAANLIINRDKQKEVGFLIVGPPTEADRPSRVEKKYLESVTQRIRQLGLTSNVKVFPKWHEARELRDLYAISDVYVLPSRIDMTPHSIKQAMCMQKPVITTRVGWVPTLVIHGQNGILVEPNSPSSLANAIEFLFEREDVRKRMGGNNARTVEERWSPRSQYEKWSVVFLQVAK